MSETTEKVTPLRHPIRWVGGALICVATAMFINALITNPHFEWSVVGDYLFSRPILSGLYLTVELTLVAMVAACVIGTVVAIMRISPTKVFRSVALGYVWIFRGTPLLVQIIFLYNISALYPRLSLGIPFGAEFISGNVNDLITPFTAAVVALSLNEGAYMSEIIRAGIKSVPIGQIEAARAFGLTRALTMRLVVLPQAMRVIVPPTANEFISLLKYTSLVSTIALPELLQSAQLIFQRTYQTIPLLIVVSLWYLTLTTVLTFAQSALERRFALAGSVARGRNPRMFGRTRVGSQP